MVLSGHLLCTSISLLLLLLLLMLLLLIFEVYFSMAHVLTFLYADYINALDSFYRATLC